MKNKLAYSMTLFILLICLSNSAGPALNNPDGNYTGSPNTIGTCDHCHGGHNSTTTCEISIIDSISGMPITTNLYQPLHTYIVRIHGKNNGGLKQYGFQALSLSASRNMAGSWQCNMPQTATRMLTGNNWILEQTNTLIATVDTSLDAYAKWISPQSGFGPVTFYAAVNAVDGNSTKYGDNNECIANQITIQEQTNSISNYDGSINPIISFNSISNNVMITGLSQQEQLTRVEIYDIWGRTMQFQNLFFSISGIYCVSMKEYPLGIYLVRVKIVNRIWQSLISLF